MLPFFCCWFTLVGRLSVLECAFWGFLLLFALLNLFPLSCVCVPLMVSCSGFGLPLHAQLLRLFVTTRSPYCVSL